MINSNKGAAYENWAKKFSAKQIAKSIIYLKEHDFANYDEFAEAVNEKNQLLAKMAKSIKDTESRILCFEKEVREMLLHKQNYEYILGIENEKNEKSEQTRSVEK